MARSDVAARDDGLSSQAPGRLGAGVFRRFASIALGIHGLAHSTGFVLLWDLAEPVNLTYAEAVPDPGSLAGRLAGLGWLLAGALFVVAAVRLYRARGHVWPLVVVATAISLAVLLPSQDGTSLGITVDLLIIVVAVKVFARGRTSAEAEAKSTIPVR